MKESYLYQKLGGQKVQCLTCSHQCQILPGNRGICGVRENQQGKLYFLAYGKIIAAHIDPIEKKPLFHFMPKTLTYSIATVGCNFRCAWCQNADISQASKASGYNLPIDEIPFQKMTPAEIVAEAIKNNCPSISYTYTEPTIFLELALDTMKIAHKKGLKNTWVSNGYFSKETLNLITPFLDAINIDLKAFKDETYQKYCGAKLAPVLENIKTVHTKKIHLEVTTLIIPGVNNSKKELTQIAEFLAKIDKNIPWHISRFFPAFKMMDSTITPIKTLELASQIGKKSGLKYVHLGNV
ncbi:MAG TPA: AmmeMemoRadiSam system radical SAM enzyme [Patescibacteria group bacterium]|nr:AmmeMemoRadiSam system radical SAM enzyme [Patescibacteria group bacterium]